MKNDTFLTFDLHGLLLAVETKAVKKMVWLPELTSIEECPSYIAGVVNLQGQLVPVMDLNRRFGHPPQYYSCSDRLIILDISAYGMRSATLGIIVNEVMDVIAIPADNIEPPPFEGRETATHPYFVSGVAKVDEKIVMILNLQTMLDAEFELPPLPGDSLATDPESAGSYFCPEATPEEREQFHSRALNLQMAFAGEEIDKSMSVAVVSIHNDFFCMRLESVREFSKIFNITPVPCSPDHIVGNMNLRGNILTVVDISGLLNMQAGRISDSTKLVVADSGEYSVGVIVDEIFDIINLSLADIVPGTSSIKVRNDKFITGMAPYGDKMMVFLDLKEILSWDGLTVYEDV